MPIKEALFWVGLTVFGTGLYFIVEGSNRMPLAIAFTLAGLIALGYSIYTHHKPSGVAKPPVWVALLLLTWAAIGYDYYDRRGQNSTLFSYAMSSIDSQDYRGGEVVLDGKLFINCSFEDVTLIYHGTGISDMRNPAFKGKIYLKTDNPAAYTFSAFQRRLKNQPGTIFHAFEKDPKTGQYVERERQTE